MRPCWSPPGGGRGRGAPLPAVLGSHERAAADGVQRPRGRANWAVPGGGRAPGGSFVVYF
eukprot:985864-Prorocentrum_minimum.AAC.1